MLKACVCYFSYFHQIIALKWKILSYLMLFFILKIFKFLNFCFPSFFPVHHYFRGWSKINLIVYDIYCLHKNLITQVVWYLHNEKKEWHWNFVNWYSLKWGTFGNTEKIWEKWKNHAENVQHKLVPKPVLIFVNKPKQPMHTTNSFKNKMYWKKIIKKS